MAAYLLPGIGVLALHDLDGDKVTARTESVLC